MVTSTPPIRAAALDHAEPAPALGFVAIAQAEGWYSDALMERIAVNARDFDARFAQHRDDTRALLEAGTITENDLLQAEGALVKCYEPYKPDAALPGLKLVPTLEEALAGLIPQPVIRYHFI